MLLCDHNQATLQTDKVTDSLTDDMAIPRIPAHPALLRFYDECPI